MDLAVGVTEIDVVVVDQCNLSDTGTRAGLGCPGSNTANANDTEMRARKYRQCGFAENTAETLEATLI